MSYQDWNGSAPTEDQINQLEALVAQTEGAERAEALFRLGAGYQELQNFDAALAAFGAALDLSEGSRQVGLCRQMMGWVLIDLERFEEALSEIVSAGAIFVKLDDLDNEVTCRLHEATALLALGQPGDALELMERTRNRVLNFSRPDLAAMCDHRAAELVRETDREAAIPMFQAARQGFALSGNPKAVAWCEFRLGELLGQTGEGEKAIEAFGKSGIIYWSCGLPLMEAACADERARLLAENGRPEEALVLHEQARPILADHGPADAAVRCDNYQGKALLALGRNEEALKKLRAARRGWVCLDRPFDVAACDDLIGEALHALGRYQDSLRHHRRALKFFQEEGLDVDVALANCLMAGSLEHLGRYKQALACLEVAKACYSELGMSDQAAWCDATAGSVLVGLGRTEEARGRIEDAEKVLDEHQGDHPDLPWLWRQKAVVMAAEGEREQALRLLDKARDATDHPHHLHEIEELISQIG